MNNNEYEKIQLTKQDLQHVYGQIYSDTTKKLNLHLPTDPDDLLKQNVAAMLDEFLLEIFEMALDAFIVDGHELNRNKFDIRDVLSLDSAEHQKTDPFDFALNGVLRNTLQKLEEETIKVTKYRRELPLQARSTYNELIRRTDNEVTDILRELEENDETEEGEEDVGGSIVDQERLHEIENDYHESLRRLLELKNIVPVQRAEIDRLDETISFLEDVNQKTR